MAREIPGDEFRRTLGLFATGVTVVSTSVGGILHAMTANAFASVSLEPPLVLVCVDRRAGMHELLGRSQVFGVTVLRADQERLAVWFSWPGRTPGRSQFDRVRWHPAPVSGCPVLDGGLAFLDCKVTETHAGGDHTIFLGEVTDLGLLSEGDPLVWFRGRYHRLDGWRR